MVGVGVRLGLNLRKSGGCGNGDHGWGSGWEREKRFKKRLR